MDTMKDIAANGKATIIFLPNTPDAVGTIQEQIRTGLLQGHAAASALE